MAGVLTKRGKFGHEDRPAQRAEGLGRQRRPCAAKTPEAHRLDRERRAGPPWEPPGAATCRFPVSGLQNLERIGCCLQPPSPGRPRSLTRCLTAFNESQKERSVRTSPVRAEGTGQLPAFTSAAEGMVRVSCQGKCSAQHPGGTRRPLLTARRDKRPQVANRRRAQSARRRRHVRALCLD